MLKVIANEQRVVPSNHLLTADQVNINWMYLKVKRLLDIICSLIGLIILSPTFLLVAILIKMEEAKGPIFFKQIRVGKDHITFCMYKFRSMATDAEERFNDVFELNEVSGAMFKIREDPRITRIGKFIRKTSLDELPQLWNVLKGEMSLVGPRPPLLREVEEYTTYDKQRLLVTPGCTGLWQVTERNNVGFKEMVELDLQYIRQRTILLDIKIMLKTAFVLIGSKTAF